MRTGSSLSAAFLAAFGLCACRAVPEGSRPRGVSADEPSARAAARIASALERLEGSVESRAAVEETLRELYQARALCPDGPVASSADRAIGRAYYILGEHALARKYLRRGLAGAEGEARQLALAMLVAASRAAGDLEAAAAYRSELRAPLSPAAAEILAGPPLGALQAASGRAAEGPRGEALPGSGVRSGLRVAEEAPAASESAKTIYVLARGVWGASPVRANVNRMRTVSRITVHHTAGPAFWDASRSGAAREIKNIQSYHQNERGWADIGYHYIIDRSGTVWQGRRLCYQGAHTNGALNEGNIGIALLGNFCTQKPTRAQVESLAALTEKLCEAFRLSPRDVYTHGELAARVNRSTSCPGPHLAAVVETIRRGLERRLVAHRPGGRAARGSAE